MEEQLELPLPGVEDNRIYFEIVTASADGTLKGCLGKYNECFIIGVDDQGFKYNGSSNDAAFWTFALDRARHFMMNNFG
jgi:hypothetical protein